MPDVTISFIGEDDVTPAIDKIKGEIDGLGKTYLKYTRDPAFNQPGPLTRAAMAAPKLPPGGGGWGGGGDEAEETTRKTRGMVAEFGNLAEQFVKWGLIWKAFETAINLVGDAINQVTTETKVAQQAINSFGLSAEEGQGYLDNYYQAAHRAGMTWDEWQKFAPPAIHALEQTGMSARDAVSEVSNLGKELDLTGVDLRKLAPAVELGAASFIQLAEAGRMMGPAWAAAETEFVKIEATEKDYQKALAQDHQLQLQAIHDTEQLANARAGFAEKSGIATVAYQSFVKAQKEPLLRPWYEVPFAPVPQLPKGFEGVLPADFKKLMGEMQKDFADGAQQMAKELDIPLARVQKYIQLGVPGFDEKSLTAAHQRGVHERDTSSERDFQQKNLDRTNALEEARLYYNREVASKLHEQDDLVKAQPDAIKQAKMAEEDLMHAIEKTTATIEKQNQDLSLGFALAGGEPTYGFPSRAAPGVKGFPSPGGPAGGLGPVTVKTNGEKLATHDEALTAAIHDLITMLQGS